MRASLSIPHPPQWRALLALLSLRIFKATARGTHPTQPTSLDPSRSPPILPPSLRALLPSYLLSPSLARCSLYYPPSTDPSLHSQMSAKHGLSRGLTQYNTHVPPPRSLLTSVPLPVELSAARVSLWAARMHRCPTLTLQIYLRPSPLAPPTLTINGMQSLKRSQDKLVAEKPITGDLVIDMNSSFHHPKFIRILSSHRNRGDTMSSSSLSRALPTRRSAPRPSHHERELVDAINPFWPTPHQTGSHTIWSIWASKDVPMMTAFNTKPIVWTWR